MSERPDLMNELRAASCGTFPELFAKYNSIAEQYGNLSPSGLITAFRSVNGLGSLYTPNPYVQNTRIKGISTRPGTFTKAQVAEMVEKPEQNEAPLRAVERGLEYTAYPLQHIRWTYQNLLTYHSYIAPEFTDKQDAKRDDFWREWKLLERLRRTLGVKDKAHEIAGQVLQEGKVFYTCRLSADKPHNKINHAFLQQLPSDWCKIVGFNNKTKYTVAFNLMYFTRYGTDVRQFGDLFLPYMDFFSEAVLPAPKGTGKTLIFAEKSRVDMNKAKRLNESGAAEVYYQNGRWYFWVTLPVERVFTFEADDTNRNVIPPFTGLFISMIQLSQMEQIQLELLQNPLVSILTGEIPYFDGKDTNIADQYKLSNAGREFFQALWIDMLTANNTGGIGLYMAPLKNMKLESLSEAPSAMDIVTKGYQDTISKSGLSAILPSATDTRAGAVQVSFQIECQFLKEVYTGFERMMRVLIEGLNLIYEWRFVMFGSLYEDEKTEESALKGMQHGLLPDLIIYNALKDRSILDDLAVSDAVLACEIMEKRLPLISTYSAKQSDAGLPPKGEPGRPEAEGVTTDGNEGDVDADN